MHFYVVVAFRNRPDLLGPCIDSVLSQNDLDYTVLLGDDASEPSEQLESVLIDATVMDRVRLMRHEQRIGVVGNQATMIRAMPMDPEDVIVFLDGDDRFAHPDVLGRLREVYSDSMVDLTYGNYAPDPPDPNCPPVKPIPAEVCAKVGGYRRWARVNGTAWNHLRTFRRRIFDAIPETHMRLNGRWLDGGADYAMMTPALELAGGRHRMIDEVLVLYTSDRPDAEWRSKSEGIALGRKHVATRRPLRPLPPMEV